MDNLRAIRFRAYKKRLRRRTRQFATCRSARPTSILSSCLTGNLKRGCARLLPGVFTIPLPAVRSPAQPQACEPRKDAATKWRPETSDNGSARPEHKEGHASTDNAGRYNEQHRLCSDLICFKAYQRFVSGALHIASALRLIDPTFNVRFSGCGCGSRSRKALPREFRARPPCFEVIR